MCSSKKPASTCAPSNSRAPWKPVSLWQTQRSAFPQLQRLYSYVGQEGRRVHRRTSSIGSEQDTVAPPRTHDPLRA